MYPTYLLLTMSLAKEDALLNDAGLLSGDAPHFRRKALTLPPPPPVPMEARLDRLIRTPNAKHQTHTKSVNGGGSRNGADKEPASFDKS